MPQQTPTARALATNAPEHWPEVRLKQGDGPLGKLHLIAAIEEAFRGTGLTIADQDRTEFFKEGMLVIDLVVADGDRQVPVFLYPIAGEEAAARQRALERFTPLIDRFAPPVYYAPEPLPAGVGPLDRKEMLRRERLPVKLHPTPRPGRYAMWYASDEDPVLLESPVLQEMDAYFHYVRGLEPRLFTFLLVDAGIASRTSEALATLMDLGGRPFLATAYGPGGVPLALSYEGGRGVRVHLAQEHASLENLLRAWRMLNRYARLRLPQQLRRNDGARPFAWWQDTLRRLREEHERGVRIGALGEKKVEGNGAPGNDARAG